ncbi:Non-heme chloroperoxidase [compost metagenome]
MPFLKVGDENSGSIDLYYEDQGKGDPVVLIHGWPLNCHSWEKQVAVLLEEGYRVIAYDRRGFGNSSQPSFGYDYDTFAADLDKLMTKLDLNDVTLVGFSMGTGEVARYLGTYGSKRVRRAAFIASIPPFLLKTEDNLEGVDKKIFDDIQKSIVADRPAYLSEFLENFYNLDSLLGKRISEKAVRVSWNVASCASAKGTLDCVTAWLTDFRQDLPRIDIPSLVIHGDADRILPIQATGNRLHKLLKNSQMVTIKGAPHGLLWTHGAEVNQALMDFLGAPEKSEAPRRRDKPSDLESRPNP